MAKTQAVAGATAVTARVRARDDRVGGSRTVDQTLGLPVV
jgi:hypothetical protein